LSETQNGPDAGNEIPHAFFRLGSMIMEAPTLESSTTRFL